MNLSGSQKKENAIIRFMVEANIGRTPHKEVLKTSELLIAPPITAHELLGGTNPELLGLALSEGPIHFYKFKTSNTTEYIGVVGISLGGYDLNQLLFSLAPYKHFGLDTLDILQDWQKIDNDPERKKRHEAIGRPWQIFDRDRLYFRNHIEKDFEYRSGRRAEDEQDRRLIPVIRWRTYRNKRELVFDLPNPLEDVRFGKILERHIPNYQTSMDIRFFNPTIGYFAVAHFSPQIKRKWNQMATYSSDCNSLMPMGPTQVGPYAIMMEETIRRAPFYSRAEKYIRANAQLNSY